MTQESIKFYLNIESDFPSASQINYASDTSLFGNLIGIQRNMEAHPAFISSFRDEIEQLIKQIYIFLDPD